MTGHRILILTASAGAGHDRPAQELAGRLAGLGHTTRVVNLVEIAPFGHALRRLFQTVLTRRPALWGRMCATLDDIGEPPTAVSSIIGITGRRIARIAEDERIDLVVSTYPLGGRVVGQARLCTSLALPLVTYVTDPAVHSLWIDDTTDLFLTTWSFTAVDLRTRTARPVSAVAPAIPASFRADAPHPAALPGHGRDKPWALVTSGSWGVGDVLGTVRDLLAYGRFRPVVVCGRNAQLRAAASAVPGALAFGWVDDMAGLMRQCEIGVLNSGGLTLAEAAAVGLAVVHHRPLPGQGELNAAACRLGLGLPVSRTAAELSAALDLARPVTDGLGTGDPAAMVLSVLTLSGELPAAA